MPTPDPVAVVVPTHEAAAPRSGFHAARTRVALRLLAPALIALVLVFQRRIVAGLTAGAVKG